MVTKECILKILDRAEQIKPSDFAKWGAFKSFGLPKIREYVTGEVKKEFATPEDAEEIFEIR
jgi:hypothetical protein